LYPSIAADEGTEDEAEDDADREAEEADEAGFEVLPELAEADEAGFEVLAELAELTEPEPEEETLTARAHDPPQIKLLSPVQAAAQLLSASRRDPALIVAAQ
jgi:hypothetical protein